MELKYRFVIYIGVAVSLLLMFLSFIKLKKKQAYKDGRKAADSVFLNNTSILKKRMIVYRLLKVVIIACMLTSIIISSILIARPYTSEEIVEEKYSRDIILCMDISTSVDELNSRLIEELKGVVKNLSNERFGVVIFNTSAVLLCPLTTDYEYVLKVLDDVQQGLDARTSEIDSLSSFDFSFDTDEYMDDLEKMDYIQSGVLVGNELRGSSLIGDGLATTIYDFPEVAGDEKRTKIVIFSTDNDLQGNPMVTLDEAGDLCKENNVTVYGIGTDIMYKNYMQNMKENMEKTGGKFYLEEDAGSMKNIVKDIDKLGKNLVKGEKKVIETEHPEYLFIALLISVSSMFLFTKVARL